MLKPTVDLDEVLPNGLTMRQQLEKQHGIMSEQSSTAKLNEKPKPVATGSTVGLLNAAAVLMFLCAAILIFAGLVDNRFGVFYIATGIGTAISAVIIKALSNIVSLLTDIRDKLK